MKDLVYEVIQSISKLKLSTGHFELSRGGKHDYEENDSIDYVAIVGFCGSSS